MSDSLLINDLLICDYCSQKLKQTDDPKLLPCNKTICNDCDSVIDQNLTKERTFDCSCSLEHVKPPNGFESNKLIEYLFELSMNQYNLKIDGFRNKIEEILKMLNRNDDEEKAKAAKALIEYKIQLSSSSPNNVRLLNRLTGWMDQKIAKINEYYNRKDEKKNLKLLVDLMPQYKPVIKILEPKPFFDYDKLRRECQRLTEGYKTRYRLKEFLVDDIIEDISIYPEKVKEFKCYLRNLRTPQFSKEMCEFLVYNSKMKNWPLSFSSNDMLKMNKGDFKKLESNIF